MPPPGPWVLAHTNAIMPPSTKKNRIRRGHPLERDIVAVEVVGRLHVGGVTRHAGTPALWRAFVVDVHAARRSHHLEGLHGSAVSIRVRVLLRGVLLNLRLSACNNSVAFVGVSAHKLGLLAETDDCVPLGHPLLQLTVIMLHSDVEFANHCVSAVYLTYFRFLPKTSTQRDVFHPAPSKSPIR